MEYTQDPIEDRIDSEEETFYVSQEEFDTLYEIAIENKEKYKAKVQENKALKAEIENLKARIKELESQLRRSSSDVSLSSVPLNYFL